LLARLKVLRGTRFDPFGYTAERRAERELMAWYEGIIAQMLDKLGTAHLPDLVAIAKAPMEIRGYGPVKDAAIAKVKPEVEQMLARLTASSPAKMRATG
jgi:indolepyruvate ferredoxin oxidoreductase